MICEQKVFIDRKTRVKRHIPRWIDHALKIGLEDLGSPFAVWRLRIYAKSSRFYKDFKSKWNFLLRGNSHADYILSLSSFPSLSKLNPLEKKNYSKD